MALVAARQRMGCDVQNRAARLQFAGVSLRVVSLQEAEGLKGQIRALEDRCKTLQQELVVRRAT